MKKKKLNGFQTKQRNQQKKINKKKLNDYTKQRNLKTTMLGINTPVFYLCCMLFRLSLNNNSNLI